MLKSMCAVIGAIVLAAALIVSTGVGTMHPHHTYLHADGGQPPPGPLPICWPRDYPCPPPPPPPPPQGPQGGGNQLFASYSAATTAAVADRPRYSVFGVA